VAERPHEAARRRSKTVAVELSEVDDVALQWAWLPVLHRWCNPLRLHRGRTGAQEPLLLHVPQPALHHSRRAPLVGVNKPHRHLAGWWKATLRNSPPENVLCRRCAGRCGENKNNGSGGMQKERQPGGASIFISIP